MTIHKSFLFGWLNEDCDQSKNNSLSENAFTGSRLELNCPGYGPPQGLALSFIDFYSLFLLYNLCLYMMCQLSLG